MQALAHGSFASAALRRHDERALGTALTGLRFDRVSVRLTPEDAVDLRVGAWIASLRCRLDSPDGEVSIVVVDRQLDSVDKATRVLRGVEFSGTLTGTVHRVLAC